MSIENLPKTIWWDVDEATGRAGVYLIDQTRLPLQGDILCCSTCDGVCTAISTMAVRGAPALGVAGAMAVAIWSENESGEEDVDSYLAALDQVAEKVSKVRPTAVNLAWGAGLVAQWAHAHASDGLEGIKAGVVKLACKVRDDDEACCKAIGEHGAGLFDAYRIAEGPDGALSGGARVMTHCNAGSLATARLGTALSVITTAFAQGKVAQAWVRETRPVNQGARLTAWELMVCGVPSVLICDDAAASVMSAGWVDAVIVGADRICANGDVVNKIGTYELACLAEKHGVPFYVAAPNSTIDLSCASGRDVAIEQRDPREVEGFTASGVIVPHDAAEGNAFDMLTEGGTREVGLKDGHAMELSRKGGGYAFDAWLRTTPPGVMVYNPAFDMTPASLVTAIVTDRGIFKPEDIARSIDG